MNNGIRVIRRRGEDDDRLLKRFNKVVEKSGIMSDAKKYEYYDKVERKKSKRRKYEERD